MSAYLKALSEAVGISGKEDAVRKVVLPAIQSHAQDIRIDPLGSITAIKPVKGKRRALRVMIAAHMDEVGLAVSGFDSDGTLKFTAIGGIDERILPGLRVQVGDALIPGVVMWAPIHKNRDQNAVKMNALRIDIGASSKDEAQGKVKLGDRVAFASAYMEVGDKFLRGKAFDDRAGCALLIDILQANGYPVEVAAQALQPDVALVLEATTAHDLPNPTAEPDGDIDPPNPVCRLGAGPALTVLDRSLIVHPPLLNFIRQTAEEARIPHQLKTLPGGGTDGGAIHTSGRGVPTAVISLPARYIHSPAAYIHRDDYSAALRLVQTVLGNITPDSFANL